MVYSLYKLSKDSREQWFEDMYLWQYFRIAKVLLRNLFALGLLRLQFPPTNGTLPQLSPKILLMPQISAVVW